MSEDIELSRMNFIPPSTLSKLEGLEIHTVRQLYDRLQTDEAPLRDFLELSEREFGDFRTRVEDVIRQQFPDDLAPRIYPRVNKRGVAAHRLNDPSRPKYYDRNK